MNLTQFEELYALLTGKNLKELKEILSEMPYPDIAEFIMELDDELDEEKLAVKVFRILPKDISADVFAYLDPDSQMLIVRSITDSEIGRLMDDLFVDDAVDFLEEVPANMVRRVLANTDKETRDIINRFLKYPDNCAGSVMTIEMVDLHDRLTVGEAIKNIRRSGVDKETIYTCYVIDDNRHLVGTIPLRRLLLNDEETLITDIMSDDEQLIYVRTMDDQEEVASIAKKYDLLSVPVVDNEGRLVGIITIDDIIDIIDEEATEDFEKMANLTPSDDEYLKTKIGVLAKNRIPWLIILLISSTFTGQIIEGFETKLAAIAGMTACIPMLMGTGGNSGSQVSTLIIRGLALDEIRVKDYFKVLWKEIRVSFMVGFVLALVNIVRMFVLRYTLGSDASTSVIFVVSFSIWCVVIVAKIMGCSLPIVAKLCRMDPAMMTGPLMSTVVDAVSLLIYFALANALIPNI
ncbi:MAG: magnesium transporter [Clostridia bacterium]|nr:magnesium transporter [Clostridia bacterium]MBQ1995007.1 magnesium transporter [Clostridia bacterium]MBQ5905994.1 magnesium transporter [Clostridia bacterium]